MDFNHVTLKRMTMRVPPESEAAFVSLNSTADKVCKRLYSEIIEYQNRLDASSDVGMQYVSFDSKITIAVESIGSIGPNIIFFEGYIVGEAGNKSRLIQHVSQLNFLLCAVSKEPDLPRRKIGFLA